MKPRSLRWSALEIGCRALVCCPSWMQWPRPDDERRAILRTRITLKPQTSTRAYVFLLDLAASTVGEIFAIINSRELFCLVHMKATSLQSIKINHVNGPMSWLENLRNKTLGWIDVGCHRHLWHSEFGRVGKRMVAKSYVVSIPCANSLFCK